MVLVSPVTLYSTDQNMGKDPTKYSLFMPEKRAGKDVENRLKIMIGKMQTSENLKKLANAVSLDCWEKEKNKPAKMDFSGFEEKLNKIKQEYFQKLPEKK